MRPETMREAYRRRIDELGEKITIIRADKGEETARVDVTGFVIGCGADELTGDIDQTERRIIVPAGALRHAGFPLPFRTRGSDKVTLSEGTMTVVRSDSRSLGGEIIAYELRVRG